MFQKLFLSFIGLIFLAIIIDVAFICGFYALANTIQKSEGQKAQIDVPEEGTVAEDIYQF